MIQVSDKHNCCGCTACASICPKDAIQMQRDIEGFVYPLVNDSQCINCGLCEQVCPILHRDSYLNSNKPTNIYALHNNDIKVWKNSSSGGVFNEIADYIIQNSGVVYGAEYTNVLNVKHKKETTICGAIKFRGSKYVQSDLDNSFREIRKELNNGSTVLFSGTPCQVEGLKRFLRREYNNLITVDIICHGVASPLVFNDYIDFINKYSLSKIIGINMKDKTFGWGYQNLRLFYKNNTSEFNTIKSNLWNKLFYGHLILRPACYKCRFTNLSRPGDLSIGDFWGVEKKLPDFYNMTGISILLCNTLKGFKLWGKIQHHFCYLRIDENTCMQQALSNSVAEPEDRNNFWENYKLQGFKYILKQQNITKLDLLINIIKQLLISCKFSKTH